MSCNNSGTHVQKCIKKHIKMMEKSTPKHIEKRYQNNIPNKIANKKIPKIGPTRGRKTGEKSIPTWCQNACDFLSLQVAQASHAGVMHFKNNQFTDPPGDSGTSRALGHTTLVPEARWRIIRTIIRISIII